MIQNFVRLIENGASTHHNVQFLVEYLERHGFHRLFPSQPWEITPGGCYYVQKDGALIAFRVNQGFEAFKIIASHLDSPGLKIKSNPDHFAHGFHQLNVEVYGGPILSSWFDKPLSIAGVVTYASDNQIRKVLYDAKRPLCIIPSLAIHMNREVNNGVAIDKQKQLLPIFSMQEGSEKTTLIQFISEDLGIDQERIISYDLDLYHISPPTMVGMEQEWILSPRLDNMSMALGSVEGLVSTTQGSGINVVACLDAEEVGSRTFNGGDSSFLQNTLERIGLALGKDRAEYLRILECSSCISADLAHSIHPNYAEKMDITNKPLINKGFVIKKSHNKKYATEAILEAQIIALANKLQLPYQQFFNHSNEIGGSTIGPMISSSLGIRTIDIGNPILGMHSERETGGVKDYHQIIRLFAGYFGKEFDDIIF